MGATKLAVSLALLFAMVFSNASNFAKVEESTSPPSLPTSVTSSSRRHVACPDCKCKMICNDRVCVFLATCYRTPQIITIPPTPPQSTQAEQIQTSTSHEDNRQQTTCTRSFRRNRRESTVCKSPSETSSADERWMLPHLILPNQSGEQLRSRSQSMRHGNGAEDGRSRGHGSYRGHVQFSGRVDFHGCSSDHCRIGAYGGFHCIDGNCNMICRDDTCYARIR